MDSIRSQVEDVISAHFPGAVTELEVIPQLEKLSGNVIWEGFAGESQRDRQQRLRNVLQNHLAPELYRQLSAVLTFSPAEINALRVYG